MSICELEIGRTATITSINGNDKLSKRLLALGCTEGTEVELKRRAPLGDPLIISVRGFEVAIRKLDAKNILVK